MTQKRKSESGDIVDIEVDKKQRNDDASDVIMHEWLLWGLKREIARKSVQFDNENDTEKEQDIFDDAVRLNWIRRKVIVQKDDKRTSEKLGNVYRLLKEQKTHECLVVIVEFGVAVRFGGLWFYLDGFVKLLHLLHPEWNVSMKADQSAIEIRTLPIA
jgi:hypothetical protein